MEYVLRLNENDLAVIATGLGEIAFKIAKPTFDKINLQIEKQSLDSKQNQNVDN